MSSDGPALAATAPAAPLLHGQLHPSVLFLRFVEAVRQSLLLVFLGVFAERWILVAAAVVFLVHLGNGLLRYLTYHYTLTASELVIREGILNRQERRIPIDRVQDLAFESTILRRFLRIAVVRVETASGEGAEAQLDSLGRGEAEHLRDVLLRLRAATPAAVADGRVAAEPEWSVYRTDPGMLLLRGLSDLRPGAILVAALGASQLVDQLGLLTMLRGAGSSFLLWLEAFPLAFRSLMLLAVVAAALGVSVALASLGNVVAFHGFALSLRADSLLCRFGLLTTRQKTLPRARVQRLRIEQTWLRRLLGVAVARADSAGAGRGGGEEAPGGFDVVVPLAPLPRIEALLPAVLPDLEAAALQRGPRRLVVRVFLKGAILLVAAAAAAAPWLGWRALWLLLLLPLPWLIGRLSWLNLAWGLWPRHLYLRWGVLGRYQVLLPTAKVQAVSWQQGPLQRLLGLCDLLLFVAGGPATRLPDMPMAEAGRLLAQVGARATAAAVRDWQPLRV